MSWLSQEIKDGKWGDGNERKRRLEAAGYNYEEAQNTVNYQEGFDKRRCNNDGSVGYYDRIKGPGYFGETEEKYYK